MENERRTRIIIIALLILIALLLPTVKFLLGDFSSVMHVFAPRATVESTPDPAQTSLPFQTTAMPTQTPYLPTEPPFIDAHAGFYDAENVDFSFLNGVNHEFFSDSENGGGWFPGKYIRDLSTGEVTCVWERYDSTLGIIDKYGAIYHKNADKAVAYLTFDLGYENGYTESILDTLAKKQVKAIFFVTGKFVDSNPELVKRIYNDGHLIGNHTDKHVNMSKQSNIDFVRQLINVELKLKALLGDSFQTLYYRPPEGVATEHDIALAKKMGYTTVFWSFAYYDYDNDAQPTFDHAIKRTEQCLHNGVVYLLHATSKTNSEILPSLIDYMREQGYSIPRIDE